MKRIDRANRVLYADVDGASEIECDYLAGDPRDPACRMPWPLGLAYFDLDRSGTPLCMGPIGDRRVLFHDDFMHGTGDTPWTGSAFGGGSISATGGGLGVVRLRSTAGAAGATSIFKDFDAMVLPPPPSAMHLSGCVRLSQSLSSLPGGTSTFANLELGGAVFGVQIGQDASSSSWRLRNLTSTVDIVGQDVVANEFAFVELIAVAESMYAGWVNGSGPYVLTDSVLGEATPFTVGAGIFISSGGSTTDFDIDHMTLSVVTVAPNLAELLAI